MERSPVIQKTYCGIDASLTSTGFCLKCGQDIKVETIKTTPKTAANDLARLQYIRDAILSRIPAGTSMVCIEDVYIPYQSYQIGSAMKLMMLATVIRQALLDAGHPFGVIGASSLKKFVLGKGVGEKSLIVLGVYKRWGILVDGNDVADAVVLAHIAESLDLRRNNIQQDNLIQPQHEVIDAVLKDAKQYNF